MNFRLRRPLGLFNCPAACRTVLLCVFLFLPPWFACAGGSSAKVLSPAGTGSPALALAESAGPRADQPPAGGNPGKSAKSDPPAPVEEAEVSPLADPPSRAERLVEALAKGYPDRIGNVSFENDDWTFEIYGERCYYADGKFLPGTLRDKAADYNRQSFYGYPRELPAWKPTSEEESARLRNVEKNRRENPIKRSAHFLDTLYRARSRDEAYMRQKQIRFLGHPVMVHYSILEELSLVEERIQVLAETNTAVRQWVDAIDTVEGWNWRNVSETESRSYHAYGAAVDILPKTLEGRATYWLWTAKITPEWWNVPYAKRYHPPEEVIKAFEAYGFAWGGKWRLFDTMHFEYRPEIFIFSGIPLADPRELR